MAAYRSWSLARAQTRLVQNFASVAYGNYRDLAHVLNFLFLWKGNFKKNTVLPTEKFTCLVPLRNGIILQHFIIQCLLSVKCTEVKNKRKLQSFNPKSGCGWRGDCLQEVPKIVISPRNLVFWKTGSRGEVVAYKKLLQPEVRLYLNSIIVGKKSTV